MRSHRICICSSTQASESLTTSSLTPESLDASPKPDKRPPLVEMSDKVKVFPPIMRDSVITLYPTESGPTETESLPGRTIVPPPSPIEIRSGILKLVRTPPTSIAAEDSRGKPSTKIPTSAEVPPTSITSASLIFARAQAPRIELVGPDPTVKIGSLMASSAVIKVPSF